ncbi:MAG: F0F1 ATP synthase subunit epsilon [Myxococcota bacterium]
MGDTLQLEIVTPERRVAEEDVTELIAPGLLGEFGVLGGHEPFVTALRSGVLQYRSAEGGARRTLAISGGFAEVAEDRVTLLVETCEEAGEIDRARAETARDRAAGRLKELPPEDAGVADAQAALDRAESRLAALTRESD